MYVVLYKDLVAKCGEQNRNVVIAYFLAQGVYVTKDNEM